MIESCKYINFEKLNEHDFARSTNARGRFVSLVRNGRSFCASSPTKVTIIVTVCIRRTHRYAVRGRPTEARSDEPSSARAERHGTTKIETSAKPFGRIEGNRRMYGEKERASERRYEGE